jgi:hypothetical protein
MKRTLYALPALGLLVALAGCSLSLLGTPIPLPTLIFIPSPTPLLNTPTLAAPLLTTPTTTMELPTITPIHPGTPIPTSLDAPTPTTNNNIPGLISGPYAVILVSAGDVLNIRSGPGADYPVSGSFPPTATNVMRSGPSAMADGDLWVQVQKPGGENGWVNSSFLTEYVAASQFCSDGRVNTLIDNLGSALSISNGGTLASLVSPAHGMTVHLWRDGIAHTFKQDDARWLFESTFEHNWGSAPASGLDTVGAFHEAVLPKLLEVFNASHSLTCDSLGTAPQYGYNPWPLEYSNINFQTVYKPGTPGVDLDFRYWLVGVEYVQGQPYVFALIHFAWEP